MNSVDIEMAETVEFPVEIQEAFPRYEFYLLESMVEKDKDSRVIVMIRYRENGFTSIKTTKEIMDHILTWEDPIFIDMLIKRITAAVEAA